MVIEVNYNHQIFNISLTIGIGFHCSILYNQISILIYFALTVKNKSREQLEAEILPRFSQAVNLGFQVLEDAFITVELKPSEGVVYCYFLIIIISFSLVIHVYVTTFIR